MIARQFIAQGHAAHRVLALCGLARSTFYYRPKAGRSFSRASTHTPSLGGVLYSNEYIIERVKACLNEEFVDYGYSKVASWLTDEEGFVINRKKVYRLMKQARLLSARIRRDRSGKCIARRRVPKPSRPFEHIQMDIKYIYVHGCRRNALLLTALDVFSRGALAYRLGWSIRKQDVVCMMRQLLANYRMPVKVTVRNDNGSQFEAALVRRYLEQMNVTQEFTHVATPDENCFIEGFHSIVESVICRSYDFESFEEAEMTINRFMNFYNQERLHGGIGNKAPSTFLMAKGFPNLPILQLNTSENDKILTKRIVESLSKS
jgi:transposase InsO family protein